MDLFQGALDWLRSLNPAVLIALAVGLVVLLVMAVRFAMGLVVRVLLVLLVLAALAGGAWLVFQIFFK